ncbi:centrosomal protein of 63 kDa-like [Babylonia areolata]|uniref:centrosomal protein of 63 kDa-like n=1 Tax=Babylonia areolata TaxID=304850 RepID=UPI003FCFBFEF
MARLDDDRSPCNMDRLSSVWAELQKSNRLPSSGVMSSCQTELQELMYQLDVMLSSKKQQWMQETEELQARLHAKEKELRTQQTALEIKTREMEDMKNQMEGLNKAQKAIVDEYEDHLSNLRSEVLKVRKEYEKLHKQHHRYKRDLQRKRDQAVDEKKEGEEEIRRLREKLQEYDSREKEWEHKVRGQQHEIDMLEAQKRTLVEKCEFIQQQSKTYQSQVGRRREMQDSAEDNLKSRISQLEANVDRSTQTIVAQKEKIEKLKGSLDEAMASHKQTMVDNERLLTDLQKANHTIQMLEERIGELEGEVVSKEDLLRAAQEDSRHYCQDLSRLEHSLHAKDDIIKHMSESHDFKESEQVKRLKESLQNARDDLKSQKQKQKSAKQLPPSSSPSSSTATSTSPPTSLVRPSDVVMEIENHSPSQRARDQDSEQNAEVQRLQLEVKKLQDKLATVNDSHGTELTAMRQKLAELSTELHQRSSQLSSLTQRSSELEHSMREESDVLDKKVAELKVAQTQVDSLRAENRRLRRDLLHNEQGSNCNCSPDTQNHVMRREMSVLRNSVEDVEQIVRSQHNSARTDTSHASVPSDRHSGSLGNAESGSERFSAMDDYLESSIRRYDDQLQFLEAQKARLEAQMSQGSRQSLRVATEERRLHEAGSRRPAQFVYRPDDSAGSEPMSLASENQFPPKVDRLELPHSSSEDELPDAAEEATQAFFEKEHEHAFELERRLNAQIDNFTHGIDN